VAEGWWADWNTPVYAKNGLFSVRMNADEDYSLYSRDPLQCPPGESTARYTEVMITKPVANGWMSAFARNRYRGEQVPLAGTVHSLRQTVSRVKDVEINFAHRGVYFFDDGEVRERNPDFEADGEFVVKDPETGERERYEFEVDAGRSDVRTALMLVGDKEAVLRYDRVPEVSRLRQGFLPGIVDEKMPGFVESLYEGQWRQNVLPQAEEDYARSVYPANGVLHVFDPNLGLIVVDAYGEVL